ncbi:PDZ domain-containing protein, partial [Acinetobacter baumannii]
RKRVDLSLSVGLTLAKDGDISAVEWDSAAFKAGLTNGDVIVAVGSTTYSPEKLKDAITAAKGGTAPITLTVRRGERLRSVAIDYHGGLRYPHL